MSWPFLHARASQLIHSTLSTFFAWCQAQVCKSGSKDLNAAKWKATQVPMFSLFVFHSLSCIIIHVWFGSRPWKVNLYQNWNLLHHYLFQRTPVILYTVSLLILHRKDFSSSANTQCRQLISHDNAHAAELTSRMRVKSLSTRAPSSRATCQVTDFNQTLPV